MIVRLALDVLYNNMQYCEQQINKQLRHVGQQEQFNHIRWQLTQGPLNKLLKPKEEGISEWISPRPHHDPSKKQHLLSYLTRKQQYTSKRYAYLLSALNQEQNSRFSRYEQKPIYSLKREESQRFSPKKINLKLPVPRFLHRGRLESEENQQNSLPLIKKGAVPVNFLRNSDKKRERGEESFSLLLREQSEIIWSGSEREGQEVYRKGRMLGMTRRQLKSFNFSSPKTERQPSSSTQLQGCITFRK